MAPMDWKDVAIAKGTLPIFSATGRMLISDDDNEPSEKLKATLARLPLDRMGKHSRGWHPKKERNK